MWAYEKKLQYPINIKQTNPALAKIVISQYGGADIKKICIHKLLLPQKNADRGIITLPCRLYFFAYLTLIF